MKRVLIFESTKHIGKAIKICGWVNTARSHGKIIFIDLRDQSGILQIVFDGKDKDLLSLAQKIRPEWVVEITGEVKKRPKNMINPEINTGEIELYPKDLKILSEAKTLPFSIETSGYEISEDKRLKYRYLDIRRERLKRNLQLRQEVIRFIRNFLQDRGFLEVETPFLTKSTPEGARDFLVPSRMHPGEFYALPQSPQQYKQLLQVAGIEKYFQIARCLRDEDIRADRQFEFSQLDLEMSFVEQEDILELTEELFRGIVKNIFPKKKITKTPFPRISYKTAVEKYNSDRPDIRNNKKDNNELAFCFVVDFPLFEKTKEKEISSSHHPFTAPKDEDIELLDKDPMRVRSWQHDLVLNGWEIGGGSIRIANPKIQSKVFKILGHSEKEIERKFGHLLEAFEYGVPPHGGIAPGIDRFLAILLEEPNIREVIAFPKTGDGRSLMMKTPSVVSKEQLREVNIKTIEK